MPNETIRTRHEIDDGALPYMRIGWGRDAEYVQLGTVIPATEGKIMVKDGDGWVDVVDPTSEAGWFVQLDRDGINRAIRTLRRARDQAFGRDE